MKKIKTFFSRAQELNLFVTLILCIYSRKSGKYVSKVVTQDYIDDIIFELALTTNLHRIVFLILSVPI